MDLATVNHLLTTTRSVRRRLDLQRPVEPRIIQHCVEIAIQAPNGGNLGRYHFVVVTDSNSSDPPATRTPRAFSHPPAIWPSICTKCRCWVDPPGGVVAHARA